MGPRGAGVFDGPLYAANTAHHRAFDDAVLSVATLHWRPDSDHPALLAAARDRLAPCGLLRVDMGGEGQIAAARAALDPLLRPAGATGPRYSPGSAVYAGVLDAAGFQVQRCQLVHQRRSIPDGAALEGWLRSQALPAYEPWLPGHDDREPLLNDLLERCRRSLRRDDGSFDQDYVRLDVLASRGAS